MTTKPCSRLSRLTTLWPLFGLALAVLLLVKGFSGTLAVTSTAQAARSDTERFKDTNSPAYQPIEQIRVGQRVITGTSDSSTVVEPATWRLLTLRAELPWKDGTLDVVKIETLQSPEWVEAVHAKIGVEVPIPLDLEEIGLPANLRAKVVHSGPCPSIQAGPGRVVLSTVNHLHLHVVELTVANDHGQTESIRPTFNHRFYSLDRNDWTTADQLAPRERLRGWTEDLHVVSVVPVPGLHTVYNLSVEGDHTYHVSSLAVHTHNTCPVVSSRVPERYPTYGMDPKVVVDAARTGKPIYGPMHPSPKSSTYPVGTRRPTPHTHPDGTKSRELPGHETPWPS